MLQAERIGDISYFLLVFLHTVFWCISSYLYVFPHISFLASQDAIEVMSVTHWGVIVRIDLTDVTLVSDDTYRRLYWCDPDDPDDPDESYLVAKVI